MTDTTPTSLAVALARARNRLGPDQSAEPDILLAHVLGKTRTYLHTWPEQVLTSEELERFENLLERRVSGEPVAYLLGRRAFWSLDLLVSPATLIPRADTELLVNEALARIPADAPWRIADLGTGSGAIALALASERPRCTVVATDFSEAALDVARRNATELGLTGVHWRHGHWFGAFRPGERFELIVSNPPYIRTDDPHLQRGDLRFEPASALASGADGLADLRQLVSGAPAWLAPGGWLLLEHGYDQGEAVRALMTAAGFVAIETCRDLENRDRVTAGRYR